MPLVSSRIDTPSREFERAALLAAAGVRMLGDDGLSAAFSRDDRAQTLLVRGLFADDARVFGLTSEGNEVAWKGYAAAAAAKVALESISRSMAVELAPYGVRSNVIQSGVTETPALAAIPGSAHLKAAARQRNPFGRLTTPRDVANAIHLLCTPDAAWINGEVIRVDGGEHISGAIR